jgi:hypothetical protein
MAITQSQSTVPASVHNLAVGRYLDSAGTPAAATLVVGFLPRYVKWLNLTDRIQYEWYEGMAADTTLKTIANGTRSLETTDGITVAATGITIDADIVLQNKQYTWEARG